MEIKAEQIKLISELKKAGLKQKEAEIYAALLELGGAYPSKIAEYTKLNRSTAYKILEELAIKGLVSELRKGKKLYYQIEKPEKLVRFADSQIRLAENRLENAKKILPEIEGLFTLTPHKPKVMFYEGLDGVLKVYADHVEVKETYEMLAYSNAAEYLKFIPKKDQEAYTKKKEKLKIKTRGIVPDTVIDKSYNKVAYAKIEKSIWPKIRYIPAKMFPYHGEVTIYGKDKVSLINFRKGAYVGVIIEDQDIHDMMAMIFELAWAGAKEFEKEKKV
ncbi:MAG TPA: helix-turn-helix domain-containing protein [Candidatus Bipolaricaulota bacterium]|nr:helix-turn-helix domain-containing protein [Candidatus Bipolaricaulota bacterium]